MFTPFRDGLQSSFGGKVRLQDFLQQMPAFEQTHTQGQWSHQGPLELPGIVDDTHVPLGQVGLHENARVKQAQGSPKRLTVTAEAIDLAQVLLITARIPAHDRGDRGPVRGYLGGM